MSLVPVRAVLAAGAFALLVVTHPATGQSVAPPATANAPQAAADREVQVAEQAFTRDPQLPTWVDAAPIPEAKVNGAVTPLLLESEVRVGDPVVNFQRVATRVNDAAALSALGRIPIAFIPDYQRVVLHTLRVWRDGAPLDRLAGAQVRFLQRETGLEQNLYSGVVQASILLDDLRTGDTIEVAYSIVGTNPVFGPTFAWSTPWDATIPLAERHVVVASPASRTIAWKGQGDLRHDVPKPRERTVDGMRVVTFDERDLQPVKAEPQTPAGYSTGRWLQFSEYRDWHAVAAWAAGLFDEPIAAPGTSDTPRATLVASLRAKPTDEERAVAALEFVQSQVRYFSVSIGTSSHRPAAPDAVLARRYGDCKDKSLLLVALLRDLGIPAEPVLARNGNRTGFDDWLPTPAAFDHVIVAADIDGSRWWLDPTRLGQHGRLARMGQVHDGAQVLVASAATTGLARIAPDNRMELARSEVVEDLVVAKLDGPGRLTVDQTNHGVAAEVIRVAYGAAQKDRLEQALAAGMDKRYPGAKLEGHVELDDDRIENRLHVRYRFELPTALARTQGPDGWTVKFVPDNIVRVLALPSENGRHAPATLANPVNAAYRFELHLPDEVSAMGDDQPSHIADAYFDWTSDRSFRGNHAVASIALSTRASTIAAADLATVRADVRKFEVVQPTNFLVRASDLKKTGVLGIGAESLAAKIRARQEARAAQIGQSIDGGQLAASDLARAYCERGRAYATLGRAADARRDGDRAVELDAAADGLSCRAAIRLTARDFDGAIDDASQAIILGHTAAHAIRGRARFATGRYAAAIEDFGRADAAGTGGEPFRDVWLAMSYRRAGQPLPDALRHAADGAEAAPWPRPALALFADRITPSRLAELTKKAGDEGEMIGTEADFVTGEYLLATGAADDARRSFETVLARGVTTYVEYDAAAAELERLRASPR